MTNAKNAREIRYREQKSREVFNLFLLAIGNQTEFVTEQALDLIHASVVGQKTSVSMSSLRSWWARGWIQLAEAKGKLKRWEVEPR